MERKEVEGWGGRMRSKRGYGGKDNEMERRKLKRFLLTAN